MGPFLMVNDEGQTKVALAALLEASGISVTNGQHVTSPLSEADLLAVLHAGTSEAELVEAIRRATLGLRRAGTLDGAIDANHIASRLSPREREVLELVARGLTADGVASELFLSVETVRTHTRNAIRKLGARNRLHAVVIALTGGVIAAPAE